MKEGWTRHRWGSTAGHGTQVLSVHFSLLSALSQVLDAPALQDDFYLNLVDWSSANTLAVGLGSCVYLWSAVTSKVRPLILCCPDGVAGEAAS